MRDPTNSSSGSEWFHVSGYRTMLLGMVTIIASTISLMISEANSLVKLFAGRAASMGGFTVLFIATPEVQYPLQRDRHTVFFGRRLSEC